VRFRRHQEAAQASTRRLVVLFVLVLLGLVLAVNGVLALAYRATMPLTAGYPALFFETNTGVVLLFVLGGCWFETLRLREGGAHVARLAGGRPANVSGHAPAERLERRFVNVVNEMALASRLAAPAAWVLPREDAINAFAAGWTNDDAVIAVTRGALERLTREELQGVVAHEFSHVVHGDTRLNMRLIGFVWGLQMVFGFGRMLASADEDGRRKPSLLFGVALMAVGSLGWLAGRLLQAAVSRQREFLADASAVQYTRLVDGLGGALRKIADQHARHVDRLQAPQSAALGHLVFSHSSRWTGWLSTHPPLRERLRRLYGRDLGPLPAQPLAPPADEPLLALAPCTAPSGPLEQGPEALRHDATQDPALEGAAAGETEALDRISRWHGPGELEAALLALVPPTMGLADWAAWTADTAHLRVAAAVRHEVERLGPAARQRVFEQLARAEALAPLPHRRAVLNAAQRRVAPPLHALRWLALRHLLRARTARLPPPGRRSTLASLYDEARVVSAWAGIEAMPAGEPPTAPARAWRAGVRLQRRLSAMERPLLLRHWRDAGATPETIAALALLLDLELPRAQ